MMIKNKYSIVLFLLFSFCGFAQDYQYQTKLDDVKKNGFHKIVLSKELLGKLRYDQTDIRIYDTSNKEVPYFSREEDKVEYSSLFHEYKILKKNYRKHGVSYLTFSNPKRKAIDNVSFIVRNTDVRKRARLSGSDDGVNWYVIKNDYLLHSMQSSTETTELKILGFPLSDYRYFRLEINDYWRLPINILKVGYYDYRSIEGKKTVFECPITSKGEHEKTTHIKVDFPQPVYLERLSFDVSGADFYLRNTTVYGIGEDVYSSTTPIAYFQLNSNSTNDIELEGDERGRIVNGLRIEIENKDDQPINIDKIKASFLKKYLVAKLGKGQEYDLRFGDINARTPEYDLINFVSNVPENITSVSHSEIKEVIKEPILDTTKIAEDTIVVIEEKQVAKKDQIDEDELSVFDDKKVIWAILVFVGLILAFVSFRMIKELGKRK